MKTIGSLLALGFVCLAAALNVGAQQYHSLTPLASFAGDGAFLAGEAGSFITTDTSQRGMCYNPVTGHLIFIDRQGGGNSTNVTGQIYVMDALSGAILSTLSTNGIEGGTVADLSVGVADDGVIFISNMVTGTNAGPFKIYRWENETSEAPTVAYSGNTLNGSPDIRWGDTMDVRGTGPNTQILMGSRVSGTTTRSAVFTTSDGLTFTFNNITAPIANPAGGIAFGPGNTFWIKRFDTALRQIGFDLTAGTGTFLKNYTDMPEILSGDALAVDLAAGLLAMISWDDGTGTDTVYLYSIANTNDYPQLLDKYLLPINNANGTGTPGFLSFAPGRLYAHSPNNGLFAFDLAAGTVPAPEIITDPAPVSVLEGNTAQMRVVAQRGTSFQWRRNTVNLPGQTNSVLIIPNVPLTAEGNYSVIVSNSTSFKISNAALLDVVPIAESYRLTPLLATAPGAQPYFITTGGASTAPNQRSFAYNALSNHIYVVSRLNSSSAVFNIYAVDASTGLTLYTLNTNGMSFAGQIGLVCIDVADDGAIYACNVDASNTAVPVWRLYRWADGNSNTVPQLVFSGDPLGLSSANRWGDAMDVRGSGINTEVIIDSRYPSSEARYVAILKPTDSTMSAFASSWWFTDYVGASFGRSIQFDSGNTFWLKMAASALARTSYDPASPMTLAGTNLVISLPSGIGPAAIDMTRKIAAGINMSAVQGTAPDTLDLYEVSDPNVPTLLSQVNFPVNELANGSAIGKVIIAGDRVFGLMEQNGLVAAKIEFGAPPPTISIVLSGGSVTLSWQGTGFILEGTTSLSAPSWSTITYTPGAPNTATDTASGTSKFYRLRK